MFQCFCGVFFRVQFVVKEIILISAFYTFAKLIRCTLEYCALINPFLLAVFQVICVLVFSVSDGLISLQLDLKILGLFVWKYIRSKKAPTVANYAQCPEALQDVMS